MESMPAPKVIGIDGYRHFANRKRNAAAARGGQGYAAFQDHGLTADDEHEQSFEQDLQVTQLAMKLQQTLEVAPLLQTFCEQTAAIVPCDSVNYINNRSNLHSHFGQRAKHHCRYQLDLEGQDLGEIECSRSRPFTIEETDLLERLLAFLIYPLRNALLYQQAVTEARRDPLTQINNRAAFNEALQREISSHQRHLTDFTLLVIDIDWFKKINDTYGHVVGDQVLKQVAAKIKSTIRRSDEVFRYGGEEFVVMLSNTDEQGALVIAERIRRTIERTRFDSQPQLSVTISAGLASSESAEKAEQTFELADKALYEAKISGRNQIRRASDNHAQR